MKLLPLLCMALAVSAAGSAQGRRGNPPPQAIDKLAADFSGVLKKVNGSKMLLEVEEDHVMEILATRKTVVLIAGKPGKMKDLVEGEPVEIEARRGPGAVEAVTIRQKKEDPEKTTNRPVKP